MIGRVRGTLVARRPDAVVVDVAGVGYEVLLAARTLAELPSLGEEVVLHTHLHVREDAMTLFGFPGEEERDLFRVLLGVSGVGPKVALAILSALRPGELRSAVAVEDAEALTVVPGVGKRSAQRLILELRPKLAAAEAELDPASSPLGALREALRGLGYGAGEIREVVSSVPGDLPLEEQLRRALQELGGR